MTLDKKITELTLQQQVELYKLLYMTSSTKSEDCWLDLESKFTSSLTAAWFKSWITRNYTVAVLAQDSLRILRWVNKQDTK